MKLTLTRCLLLWIQLFRVIIGSFVPANVDILGSSECHFDMCNDMATEYCHNNGTCTLQKHTCTPICTCLKGFQGNRCQYSKNRKSETDTKCGSFGIPCVNGKCNADGFGFEYCQCSIGWVGDSCDEKIEDDTEEFQTIGEPSNNKTVDRVNETLKVSMFNICSEDYLLRALEERQCGSWLQSKPCVHGVCKREQVDKGNYLGYEFRCECDLGAYGTHCEKVCCLDCGQNGKCEISGMGDNSTEECNCKYQYTGEFCEIFEPEPVSIRVVEDRWYLWLVGVCVAIFVLLMVVLIVAPYMLWRHRVILVMKIVHYFQPYEDDDEKEYDAFVSYRADDIDERFVVHELYPKLEEELGFKLCLHFRDFVPGEVISNNIINAVERSRRTILILTPRYVQSEFTKFEYQKAQEEMLKKKHRIIPIMLEDISNQSSELDKNLKSIISSVTYLEWPDSNCTKKMDKFWKRLQLSMPKKKVMDSMTSAPKVTSENVSSFSRDVFSLSHSVSSSNSGNLKDSADFENTKSYEHSFSYDSGIDVANFDTVYYEIRDIDQTLTNGMIRPLSEEDENDLCNIADSTGKLELSSTSGDVSEKSADKNQVNKGKEGDESEINMGILKLTTGDLMKNTDC